MLILRHLSISSFCENIAYIHRDCQTYNAEDVKYLSKIEIHGGAKSIFAFLQITDNEKLVKPNEIALNDEAFEQINLPEGAHVSITGASNPPSLTSIKRKVAGNIISSGEYGAIINDITTRRYSNMDISSFLVASGSFMSAPEVLSLTEAMVGDKIIKWDNENIVVDHHSMGGVPGNKTDLIITPIVAAYGLPIPKTASHSLTSCAGVADTMSVLCDINLEEMKLKNLIKENRGAITSYTSLGISEASQIISSVERQIGITSLEHIVASVLSIKVAAGVTHLLLDIPVGANARIKTTGEAMRLRKLIEYVGDMLSIHVEAVITDGSEPIGDGIGAVLEARDVMKVLRNKSDAPEDLREKSLFLAGRILEFDPKLRGGQGYQVAKEILMSGRALETMNKIIYAQGKASQPKLGNLTRDVTAQSTGTIESIDTSRLNKIGIWAGAGKHHGAGLDLVKKIGDRVEKGDIIYRIHSVNSTDFAFANSVIDGYTGYEISSKSSY